MVRTFLHCVAGVLCISSYVRPCVRINVSRMDPTKTWQNAINSTPGNRLQIPQQLSK